MQWGGGACERVTDCAWRCKASAPRSCAPGVARRPRRLATAARRAPSIRTPPARPPGVASGRALFRGARRQRHAHRACLHRPLQPPRREARRRMDGQRHVPQPPARARGRRRRAPACRGRGVQPGGAGRGRAGAHVNARGAGRPPGHAATGAARGQVLQARAVRHTGCRPDITQMTSCTRTRVCSPLNPTHQCACPAAPPRRCTLSPSPSVASRTRCHPPRAAPHAPPR